MNIKSLLLGSAAALVAVSGARAADAVVVAEPEPVEYVRVCDVYGAGYFYIPGTETCLRIGGYVRYQMGFGDLFDRESLDHLDGSVEESWDKYARLSLQTWTATETELGTLRTFTETRFNFVDGVGADGFGTTDHDFTLNFAWIELGGFRIGKDESAFTTFLDYAGAVLADDAVVPFGPYDTNLISYTFNGGNGFSAIVALEEGSDEDWGNYVIDSYVPHVVAGAKFTQGWGGIGVVGGYDSIYEVFSVKARLDVKINETFSAFVMGGWGEDDEELSLANGDAVAAGFGGWNFYKPWGGAWAVWGGFTAQVSPKAAINGQVAYDDFENFAANLNVAYEIVPGFRITPEVVYADNFDDELGDTDGEFGGLIRFQRSF